MDKREHPRNSSSPGRQGWDRHPGKRTPQKQRHGGGKIHLLGIRQLLRSPGQTGLQVGTGLGGTDGVTPGGVSTARRRSGLPPDTAENQKRALRGEGIRLDR